MPANSDFFTHLSCGALGVRQDFETAMDLAVRHGFGGIEPDVTYLRSLDDDRLADLRRRLDEHGLRWGNTGVPVDLNAGAADFARQLADLEEFAGVLRKAGVTRAGTWIRPMSDGLTYRRNFARHVERIALVDEILSAAGIRFGLEYVGPKTFWSTERYPFVHTLAEVRELIAAVGSPNVGVVLDSFHWYTSGETPEDLLTLSDADVVAVDVNDAPTGLARDEQQDQARMLPGATGVIDLSGFVDALRRIGYSGPVKVEPFNADVAAMPAAEAVAAAAKALRQVLGT